MKRFIVEYINIIGYVMTGLIFAFATFMLFVNFYHYKEVNNKYVKSKEYTSAYDRNKEKIDQIRNNASVFDANTYKGRYNTFALMNIKSGLEICADKYTETSANKLFAKQEIMPIDDYRLLTYYQSDIINDCIVLHVYSVSVGDQLNEIPSYAYVKPFVDNNTKSLINDMDYVKRTLQFNSSYQFSSDYSRGSIYNVTRDSYSRIEASYNSSVDMVLAFSEWFKNVVQGGI